MTIARLCRGLALVIAIAAVADPAVTRPVAMPPSVGVIVAAPSEPARADAVVTDLRARLDGRATLSAASWNDPGDPCRQADVCVAVVDGTTLPSPRVAGPLHVLRLPPPSGPTLVAARVDDGHLAEMARARVAIAGGRAGEDVVVVVREDGAETGRIRHTRTAAALDDVIVPWWPRRSGGRLIQVEVESPADGAVSRAVAWARTNDVPMEVLVWEARPGWTGTFVRRALAADARFLVRTTSMVAPGRALTRGVAATPTRDELWRAQVAIVAGADALTSPQVRLLDAYARAGGAIVMALDGVPGAPATALLPSRFTVERRTDPVAIGGLRATEFLTFGPSDGVAVLTAWERPSGAAAGVIVERMTGNAGRVVVSGVMDAWRWRGRDGGFDREWRDLVARTGRAVGPSLALEWRPARSPSADLIVRARVAGATGWPDIAVATSCEGGADDAPLRAWPDGRPGTWRVATPTPPTRCEARVQAGPLTGASAVPEASSLPTHRLRAGALEALARVSGGTAGSTTDAVAVVSSLVGAVPPHLAPRRQHPMRSPWWLVPFVAALGAEWVVRRRARLP